MNVDGDRLLARLRDLGAIGGLDGGGCARLALTDEDRRGRDLVVSWMADLGLDITVDTIGNVVATLAGQNDGPPVMTGSHIDTVRTGGWYDGNYGVLAGLEVIESVIGAGITPRRPMAVAFFTNEEGARFHPDMLGSLVYAGGMSAEEAHDTVGIDGARLGDELTRIGYLGGQPCPGAAPFAFVELHIEQGPVLEAAGIDIGVVSGVQGISWLEFTFVGKSSHAGTTPMDLRNDPGFVAMSLAAYAREITSIVGRPQVCTVGRATMHPNLTNVVPATATITVDLRNTDESQLQRAEQLLLARCAELAAAEGVTVERRSLARFQPVDFDPRMMARIDAAAARIGLSTMVMPSGAGHDAQMIARMSPTAMIFVESVNGLSHNVNEHTDPADLVAGANVLFDVMVGLATEEDPWAES